MIIYYCEKIFLLLYSEKIISKADYFLFGYLVKEPGKHQDLMVSLM